MENKKELLEKKEQEYIQLYLQYLKKVSYFYSIPNDSDCTVFAEAKKKIYESIEKVRKLHDEIMTLRGEIQC